MINKLKADLKEAANMLEDEGYVKEASVLDHMGNTMQKKADMNQSIRNAITDTVSNDQGTVATAQQEGGAGSSEATNMMLQISGLLNEAKLKLHQVLAGKGMAVQYSDIVQLFSRPETQIVSGIESLLKGEPIGKSKSRQKKQESDQKPEKVDPNMQGMNLSNQSPQQPQQQQQTQQPGQMQQ